MWASPGGCKSSSRRETAYLQVQLDIGNTADCGCDGDAEGEGAEGLQPAPLGRPPGHLGGNDVHLEGEIHLPERRAASASARIWSGQEGSPGPEAMGFADGIWRIRWGAHRQGPEADGSDEAHQVVEERQDEGLQKRAGHVSFRLLVDTCDVQQRLEPWAVEEGRQLTTTVVTQTMVVRDTSFSGLMGKGPYMGRTGTNSQRRAVKRGNSMIRDSSTNIMKGCLHEVTACSQPAALDQGNTA